MVEPELPTQRVKEKKDACFHKTCPLMSPKRVVPEQRSGLGDPCRESLQVRKPGMFEVAEVGQFDEPLEEVLQSFV